MTTIVAVTSDLHCNSTVALCPPVVQLDDGGIYYQSTAQKWLWDCWEHYWKQVETLVQKYSADLFLVFNGDLVEGSHHGTTQLISHNLEIQARIALDTLDIPLSLNPTCKFIIRGTETHVGRSAQHEESIAQIIGAEPETDTGASSWWWLPLEADGVKFDIAHHGRTGYRPWTKPNATNLLAAQLVMEYAQRKATWWPDVAIRSHIHSGGDSYDNYRIRVLQTLSWQLSTSFGHRIAPGNLLPIGGYIFICNEGKYELYPKENTIYKPKESEPWTINHKSQKVSLSQPFWKRWKTKKNTQKES